jgi:hypothetical protein
MEMNKKLLIFLVLTALMGMVGLKMASAQGTAEFTISLTRSFGYGGFGNDIQGFFQIKLKGPLETVQQVTYTLDDQAMGTVTESPFKLDFNTDDFLPGERKLGASVKLLGGTEVQAQVVRVRILSKQDVPANVFKILGPILALVAGAAFLSSVVAGRGKNTVPGQAQNYSGMYGGAICPKCGHPFPRSFFGINLAVMRVERCPSCGKWISSRRASAEELAEAERAEAEKYRVERGLQPERHQDGSPDEKAIDDSRYLDE